ncbi:MAG: hypothetical protein E7615_03470 [Ruminococcaceae bacterium]|nr:hypothetical protein [Oscillospiraceae bacterium]
MKKLVLLLCVCLIIIGLVACADEKTGAESTDGTENHTIESESQTEPVTALPEESETVPETAPETEPETEPVQTEPVVETKKEVTPNEYATFVKCEPNSGYRGEYRIFHVVNSAEDYTDSNNVRHYEEKSALSIYEYDINYTLVAGGRYYKGTFILPEGYENGFVFYVESNEEKTLFSAFVCAEKDGKTYYFEYVFDMSKDTDKPIALNTVCIEKVEEIIILKNNASEKIYDALDAHRRGSVLGEYEITLPIAFSGFNGSARVVYVEDESDLETAVLRCNSGYAFVYYLEEFTTYTIGMPYKTIRYKFVPPKSAEGALDEGAKRHNNERFVFMAKIDDHYYAYIAFSYRDPQNPPEDYEEQLINILKEMKVEYTVN